MTGKLQLEVAEVVAHDLEEAHLVWSTAAIESGDALHAWFQATGSEQALRYVAYHAALDREEAAARDLERLVAKMTSSGS